MLPTICGELKMNIYERLHSAYVRTLRASGTKFRSIETTSEVSWRRQVLLWSAGYLRASGRSLKTNDCSILHSSSLSAAHWQTARHGGCGLLLSSATCRPSVVNSLETTHVRTWVRAPRGAENHSSVTSSACISLTRVQLMTIVDLDVSLQP